MTVKEHYDKHLGSFYSWMVGDFESNQKDFQQFLIEQEVVPQKTNVALDLGAGHGIQSVALSKIGFDVTAVDFNKQLLEELKINAKGLSVHTVEGDIRTVKTYGSMQPELIICWGDTLTHLESKDEIEMFIQDCAATLTHAGKMMLSFRDYSIELKDDNRFIPVKSDDQKILTCFLEYQPEFVRVTDLLNERTASGWVQKVSSYHKIRISPIEVEEMLRANKMNILFNESVNRLQTIIAKK